MMKTFLSREDLVGNGGGGAVGAFAENLAAETVGVAAGDDVLGRRGDKDLAGVGEEFSPCRRPRLRRNR